MKKVKPLRKKHREISAIGVVYKRINHFLDFLENVEEEVYEDILGVVDAPKLDAVERKKIKYPGILFPGKDIPLEWWYFTGHLSSDKKKFGFEYCFFKIHPQALRAGFIPLSFIHKKPYLMINIAITDKTNKTFTKFQDSGIIHPDHITYDKLDLSLNTTTLKFNKQFKIDSELVSLTLKPVKKIVKHFEEGYKLEYDKPPHRTYYVTFPRLETKGEVRLEGKTYNVSGVAWFDHQKCNVPHRSPVHGWNWFSIIFDDNTELMFFMLRDKKGFNKKYFGGSFIDVKGNMIELKSKDVRVKYLSKWKSPNTGIVYPSGWNMEIPKFKMKLKIMPCVKNQEMDTLLTAFASYWEGACDVTGTKYGKRVSGQSYVELVGYDKRLIAQFISKSIQ